MYTPEGMNPAVFLAIYNGLYLIVELVFGVIVMHILVKRSIVKMYL